MDYVRDRTRMSIADVLATMARVGGNIVYSTGQGLGQGIGMVVDAYNWVDDDNEEDKHLEPEPPIDEKVLETTQGLMRRGANRSRSLEKRAPGSNEAGAKVLKGNEERKLTCKQFLIQLRL